MLNVSFLSHGSWSWMRVRRWRTSYWLGLVLPAAKLSYFRMRPPLSFSWNGYLGRSDSLSNKGFNAVRQIVRSNCWPKQQILLRWYVTTTFNDIYSMLHTQVAKAEMTAIHASMKRQAKSGVESERKITIQGYMLNACTTKTRLLQEVTEVFGIRSYKDRVVSIDFTRDKVTKVSFV